MKAREHHHHHHHHKHTFGERHKLRTKSGGFIKRTIKGLAKKFDVSKRTIIIGFVILFLFTKIFALLAFFLAYQWVKNPGKFEDMFDRIIEKSRRTFDNMGNNKAYQQAATGRADPSYADYAQPEDGFDFSDLKAQFKDLEKRTGDMEEHVASDDYKLRKEFEAI